MKKIQDNLNGALNLLYNDSDSKLEITKLLEETLTLVKDYKPEPKAVNYFVAAEMVIKCKNGETINTKVNCTFCQEESSIPNFDHVAEILYESFLAKCNDTFKDTVINYETFITSLSLI